MRAFTRGVGGGAWARYLLALAAAALALIVWRQARPADEPPAPGSDALEPARWPDDRLTLANLGHASLLINYFGVRVISDPTLFDRVGLSLDHVVTIGPARHTPAPLKPSELPPLDLILVTHAHMDHLDLRSLAALPKNAVVVACKGCRELIAPLGFDDVRELNWGQSTTVKGLTITALGARHWGRRWPWGVDRGYNSYLLDRQGCRMLLACDTALTDIFATLSEHPPTVAAFSIGSYDPWIWTHANPEEVWRMFEQIGARYLVPIHWGTFKLSREPMDEPLKRLLAAAGPERGRVVLRSIGAAWTLPPTPSIMTAGGPGGGGGRVQTRLRFLDR